MTAMTAAPAQDEDLAVILPEPTQLEIGGIRCDVKHLKAREFFQLMGIVTKALGPNVAQMRIQPGATAESLGADLAVILAMTIPEQLEEFMRFCRSIVVPEDPADGDKLTEALENPEPDELLALIDALIENEKDNLYELLGKAKAYLAKWSKTFQQVRDQRPLKSSTTTRLPEPST